MERKAQASFCLSIILSLLGSTAMAEYYEVIDLIQDPKFHKGFHVYAPFPDDPWYDDSLDANSDSNQVKLGTMSFKFDKTPVWSLRDWGSRHSLYGSDGSCPEIIYDALSNVKGCKWKGPVINNYSTPIYAVTHSGDEFGLPLSANHISGYQAETISLEEALPLDVDAVSGVIKVRDDSLQLQGSNTNELLYSYVEVDNSDDTLTLYVNGFNYYFFLDYEDANADIEPEDTWFPAVVSNNFGNKYPLSPDFLYGQRNNSYNSGNNPEQLLWNLDDYGQPYDPYDSANFDKTGATKEGTTFHNLYLNQELPMISLSRFKELIFTSKIKTKHQLNRFDLGICDDGLRNHIGDYPKSNVDPLTAAIPIERCYNPGKSSANFHIGFIVNVLSSKPKPSNLVAKAFIHRSDKAFSKWKEQKKYYANIEGQVCGKFKGPSSEFRTQDAGIVYDLDQYPSSEGWKWSCNDTDSSGSHSSLWRIPTYKMIPDLEDVVDDLVTNYGFDRYSIYEYLSGVGVEIVGSCTDNPQFPSGTPCDAVQDDLKVPGTPPSTNYYKYQYYEHTALVSEATPYTTNPDTLKVNEPVFTFDPNNENVEDFIEYEIDILPYLQAAIEAAVEDGKDGYTSKDLAHYALVGIEYGIENTSIDILKVTMKDTSLKGDLKHYTTEWILLLE